MSYRLHKELRFKAGGQEFAVISYDPTGDTCFITETRKNGQEDCRMHGDFVKCDGKWVWGDDWTREQFRRYGSTAIAEAVLDYINTHPIPMELL